MKNTNGTITKYIYGRGLIGEDECCDGDSLKIYHFDYRGSTVAITDVDGNITDTFKYDTYGKLISRTGTSNVIFGYNGRDGVVTDDNGLIYMRARYYSPDMKRFINADIVAGKLSNAITLNRFAYANGNPVSFVDPFGLSAERGTDSSVLDTTTLGVGGIENSVEYPLAIYVVDFIWGEGGLPILGHTRLYFYSPNNGWCSTEFSGNIAVGKSSATIIYNNDITLSEISYNFENNTVDSTKGVYAVVLNGNFDKSVESAVKYSSDEYKEYNGYNIFFSNCSDYTDELLSEADIDGLYLQTASAKATFISPPIYRAVEMITANFIDTIIKKTGDAYMKTGESVSSTFPGVGANYKSKGYFLVHGMDLIGDIGAKINIAVQPITDTAKDVCKTISDAIYTGATRIWNFLTNIN